MDLLKIGRANLEHSSENFQPRAGLSPNVSDVICIEKHLEKSAVLLQSHGKGLCVKGFHQSQDLQNSQKHAPLGNQQERQTMGAHRRLTLERCGPAPPRLRWHSYRGSSPGGCNSARAPRQVPAHDHVGNDRTHTRHTQFKTNPQAMQTVTLTGWLSRRRVTRKLLQEPRMYSGPGFAPEALLIPVGGCSNKPSYTGQHLQSSQKTTCLKGALAPSSPSLPENWRLRRLTFSFSPATRACAESRGIASSTQLASPEPPASLPHCEVNIFRNLSRETVSSGLELKSATTRFRHMSAIIRSTNELKWSTSKRAVKVSQPSSQSCANAISIHPSFSHSHLKEMSSVRLSCLHPEGFACQPEAGESGVHFKGLAKALDLLGEAAARNWNGCTAAGLGSAHADSLVPKFEDEGCF